VPVPAADARMDLLDLNGGGPPRGHRAVAIGVPIF